MTSTEYLVWGALAHLVGDFLLQNAWMAEHKADLRQPAGWVHASIHASLLSWVFPIPVAAILGLVHLLVDTRVPLNWWRLFFGQTRDPGNPVSLHVAILGDQALHLVCIAIAALVCGRH